MSMNVRLPILVLVLSLVIVGIVDADAAPVAAFSANVTTGCAPLHVAFTDATTRSPINWDWYFWANETKSSDLQNPTYVFPAGTYNIRLYANTATHGDWENKSSYIATTAAPVAAFSGNPTSGDAPLSVTFTDASTNSPDNWDWYWSADEVKDSDTQSPVQSFDAGTYNVRLYVSNCGGTQNDWENKSSYITANAAASCTGDYCNFTDFIVNSTQTLTNYQVKMILDNRTGSSATGMFYTNGTTRSDWKDIKWTDTSNNTLGFWKQNGTDTSTNSTWWVKVPNIANDNTTKIRLFYGNASKTTSYADADATFVIFDDFNGASVNTSKWTVSLGTPAVGNSILTLNNEDQIKTIDTLSYNHSVIGRWNFTINTENCYFILYATGSNYIAFDVDDAASGGSTDQLATFDKVSTSYTNTAQGTGYNNAYHTYEFTRAGTTSVIYKIDGNTVATHTTTSTIPTGALGIYLYSSNAAQTSQFDFIAVRKYNSTEPFLTVNTSGGGGGGATAPVASFTASKTSGTNVVSVDFTDTSTNTPSAWNWTYRNVTGNNTQLGFSTSQNPTQSFGLGNYSIALNASNSGGSNWSAQTTYINVSYMATMDINNWSRVTDSAPMNFRWASNAIELNNKIYMYGGGDGVDDANDFSSQAWSFDGTSFTLTNASPAMGRRHATILTNFKNSLVAVGGLSDGSVFPNDVWNSTDGVTWTLRNSTQGSFRPTVLTDNTTVWMIAGSTSGGVFQKKVLSSTDLITWTTVNASPAFSARAGAGGILNPNDNYLYIMGGIDGSNDYNDIWKADKNNAGVWTQVTASASWAPRYAIKPVMPGDGYVYIIGGYQGRNAPNTYYNDIWRASLDDLSTWTNVTPSTTRFYPIAEHAVVSMNGVIYVFGGSGQSNGENGDPRYVWSSNPVWKTVTSVPTSVPGWSYNQTLTVNSTKFAYEVPIPLTVFKGTGTTSGSTVYLQNQANADYSDVRFTDSSMNQLDYWHYNINASAEQYWVELLQTPITQTIYVHYGNASASDASNGINTFTNFDDFSSYNTSSTARWNQWITVAGSPSVSGGALSLASGANTNQNLTHYPTYTNTTFSARINYPNNEDEMGAGYTGGASIFNRFNAGNTIAGTLAAHQQNSGSSTSSDLGAGYNASYHVFNIERNAATNASYWIDSGAATSLSANLPTGAETIYFYEESSTPATIDWMYVRNSINPMPSYVVVLSGSPPVASFTKDKTSGTAPLTVTFTDSSTNSPSSWLWVFGDGDTTNSTNQNPIHTYATAGTYNVNVTATNSGGSNTSATQPITVNTLYAFAGFTANTTSGGTPLPVLFTDSSTNATGWSWFFGDEPYTQSWVQQTENGGWGTRIFPESVELQNGSIIIAGGDHDGSTYYNDTWISVNQGISWTQQNSSSGWEKRDGGSMIVTSNDTIILFGGVTSALIPKNDTWVSTNKGVTWSLINPSSGWQTRYLFPAVVLSDDSIVLMGGYNPTTSTYLNDTWRSSDYGATWVQQNASSGWSARRGHGVVRLSDDSIVLFGGQQTGSGLLNDTWKSTDKGLTWTLINSSSGWGSRYYSSYVVQPDDAIILIGGQTTSSTLSTQNDTWKSTDNGTTWVSVGSGMPLKTQASAVSLKDGSFLLIAGTNSTARSSSVWRYQPAGSESQNPTHTYTTTGSYNVALSAYNSQTYNVTLKKSYIVAGGGVTPPVASFTVNRNMARIPQSVTVTDTSTNTPTSWQWSWGDGTVNSTTQNPTHSYMKRGRWNIILTATNTGGSGVNNSVYVRSIGYENYY